MARNIMHKTRGKSSKAVARIVHSAGVQDEMANRGGRTAYRRSMDALVSEVNRNNKRMSPEKRRQLGEAKDELRRLSGTGPRKEKGKGGPGDVYYKEKAKSRRNPTQGHNEPNKPRGRTASRKRARKA
jgi:predicted flap endonuclease-1-like 5' DNA nuclease